MSDLAAIKNNVQIRAFRSVSFNRHPPLGSHRSRRTLSFPTREKPAIPPVITENPEFSKLVYGEQHTEEEMPKEEQPKQQQILLDCYEIGTVDLLTWTFYRVPYRVEGVGD